MTSVQWLSDAMSVGVPRLFMFSFAALLVACSSGGGDIISPFTMTDSIAVADLNGDLFTDMVTANRYIDGAPPHPGHLSVIHQVPGNPGVFSSGINYPIGSDPDCVEVGDLNHDGFLDLIGTNNYEGSISVLLQDASQPGTFFPAKNYPSVLSQHDVAIGDLNGDGFNDVAVAGSNIVLLFNDPLNPGNLYAADVINRSASSLDIADLNSDGRMDLVSSSTNPDVVSVMLQDASPSLPGQFTTNTNYTAGLQPIDIAIGDLDGDGRVDMAVANLGAPSDPDTASLSILFQEHAPLPAGSFQLPQQYQTGPRSRAVDIGDLNDDLVPDIVVANGGKFHDTSYMTVGSVSVFLQTTPAGSFMDAQNYQVNSQQLDVAISDLNHDGLNDIAIADSDGARVRFQSAGAPGTFDSTVLLPN